MLRVPSDKSITQRALLLAAAAEGTSLLERPLRGGDPRAVVAAVTALGAVVRERGADLEVEGVGARRFRTPAYPLDLRNSGTGARLLLGLLAGQGTHATLTGDASLSRRPMRRVLAPLESMGAVFPGAGETLPIEVRSQPPLRPFRGRTEVPSAQVKSAILLAALGAAGETRLEEPLPTRDHTERMLPLFGVPVAVEGREISLCGPAGLRATVVPVPADPSSAAPLAAVAAARGGDVVFPELLLNPRRTAFFGLLSRMGAGVSQADGTTLAGEERGSVRVQGGALTGVTVDAHEVPDLIDELPLVAVLGALARGSTEVRGAGELRLKESDRIEAMAAGLRALGARIDTAPDGFVVHGGSGLRGGSVQGHADHRIAMALAVAALCADGPTVLHGADCVAVSYPGFFADLESLCGPCLE